MSKRKRLPADVQTILRLLSYCRPHGTRMDRTFRRKFLTGIPGAYVDAFKNVHVSRGDNPGVLWSCHTDTVHRTSGRQRLEYHASTGIVCLPTGSPSNCLGADDTIGVWLCLEMIRANVPGHYVFHYGEESGGIGSGKLARAIPETLRDFKLAIALDRAGYGDVITHQYGQRTCSEACAQSIGDLLQAADPYLGYQGTHGVYTDTAEYADLIPECTNLSVGYGSQHSRHEYADLGFARRLRDALIRVDWTQVLIDRDPSVRDFGGWRSYRNLGKWEYDDDRYNLDTPYDRDYTLNGGKLTPSGDPFWYDDVGLYKGVHTLRDDYPDPLTDDDDAYPVDPYDDDDDDDLIDDGYAPFWWQGRSTVIKGGKS